MNPAIMFCCFLPILIVLLQQDKQRKDFVIRRAISKRKGKEICKMVDLIKGYIGKECLIYMINSQITGVITEVTDNGIVVDNGKGIEIANLDYIIRIREFPRNKKGKKKSIVF